MLTITTQTSSSALSFRIQSASTHILRRASSEANHAYDFDQRRKCSQRANKFRERQVAVTPDFQELTLQIKFDIVRVSLRTAIRFIADLQRREEEAFPDLRLNATDRSIGSSTDNISFGLISADEWVDEIMHEAEEKGANSVPQVKCVAERMKTEQEGNGYRCQSSLIFPRGGYSLCCGSRWRDDNGGWMVIRNRLLTRWWWGRTDRTPCAALHSCWPNMDQICLGSYSNL